MPAAPRAAPDSAPELFLTALFGLSQGRRLRRPIEFEATRRGGFKVRDLLFVVNGAKTGKPARIGIVVSRRVSLKAVTRNRIKRQIRESFRRNHASLHGLDIVVIAQAAAATVTNPNLGRSLHTHWERLVQQCSTS